MAAAQPYNPVQVAQSMANAQYNPAIASLKSLLANLGTQDQFNQHQIGGWYGQMQQLMQGQQAQQGQATTNQIADLSGQLGNVAQLFGANNAQQMQPALGNAAGMLASVGQSNKDYLSNMVPLLAAQAAESTKSEQNTARAQRGNYTQQLLAQQQAKGSAYNADYQQAVSNHTIEQQNALALQQARALMPYQISSARSQAEANAANAAAAPAYNAAKVAAANAQATHYQALTEAEKAAAQATITKLKAGDGTLATGSTSYGRVQKLLVSSLYSTAGKGHPIMPNAIAAQRSLAQEAVAQGLIDSKGRELVKGAVNMMNATLASLYQRTPTWQKKYLWNTGANGKTPHFSKR